MSKGRLDTRVESNCLRDPAVAFLGLANRGSPSDSRIELSLLNPERVIITSPRASNTLGNSPSLLDWSRSGILRIVRRFLVTSSPETPSPRVTPTVNCPSS